jgi:Zn-dependent M16 (insulinase) family peptidase
MHKKQLLLLSAISALIVSGLGTVSVFASNSTSISNHIQNFQERFGIVLTEEQKTQIQTKETEMENKRATELTEWQNMTLATWKQQQIDKINATTQEEFDKIKEQQVNRLKNGKGFGPGFSGQRMEKPAE